MDQMQRISALFVEGKECYLGDDDSGKPVVIWVNKLNSFEREDAQRDGIVARAARLVELGPDSPETQSVRVEMSFWDDDRLREAIVDAEDNEIYIEALNDLSVDPEFRELEEYVRSAPSVYADSSIADNDPRFKVLEEKSGEYSRRLTEARTRVRQDHLDALSSHERKQLEDKYLDQWRTARAFNEYAAGKRTTELFLALRVCQATLAGTSLIGEQSWDHSACDHTQRFCSERASIRKFPDPIMVKIGTIYNELQVDPRDAGNSDAPASSSDSSEPSSAPEAPSTPSSPVATSDVAPGTSVSP